MTIIESSIFHPSTKSTNQPLLPTRSTNEFNDVEKKYWLKKYALGTKNISSNTKAKQSSITTISNTIVEGISFGNKDSVDKVAIATGPRVCIKDVKSVDKIDRYIPFIGPVYCVQFRDGDGRVLALGGDNGLVRIVDLSTRATLRTFTSGSHTIRVVRWLRDGKRLVVGSDDGRLYVWDLTKDLGMDVPKPAMVLIGHGDSVRDCLVWRCKDSYFIISASYDHTIRFWNVETGECERILFGHNEPIEAICAIPGTNLIASVSNVSLYLHDMLSGDLIRTCPNTHHAKTISSILYYHDEEEDISRIITAGIDGFIRIHDPNTLTTLHGAVISSPISTISFSKNKELFLIGTSTGTLLFHTKAKPTEIKKRKAIEPMKGTYSYFFRTNKPQLASCDHIIPQPKKKSHIIGIQKYDNYLRKFQYSDALDYAFSENRNATSVHTVLSELAKRNGLIVALSNRDKSSVVPIVSFIIKHINHPDYCNVFIQTGSILLDIYYEKYIMEKKCFQKKDEFEKSLDRLKYVVDSEIRIKKSVKDCLVTLDCCLDCLDED